MRKFDRKTEFISPRPAEHVRRHLNRFTLSEDGSMTILALFLFMIVFTAAGFAVDVMRYDRERVKLQYALDRAVLAAADLDQDLCPRDVVKDYLSKENLDQFIVEGSVKVTPETCGAAAARLQGKRRVEAQAEMKVATHFMQWSGVDHIESTATSIAEESIGNVEISLVLDVSGSMAGTKLTDLKSAASDFVDEMTTKSEDGKLSISVIPYSEQVSVPQFLMDELNTTGGNEVANCIDFQSADFNTTTFDAYDIVDPDTGAIIRKGSTVRQTLHFRDNGGSDFRQSDSLVSSNICRQETATDQRVMTIMQKDATTIKEQIDLLQASGWTSIDVGLKWGLALLDDSVQPLIAQLSDDGEIPSEFATRPGRNRTSDTIKVVVLMTDGENTRQHMVNPPYNEGDSPIYWNEEAQVYSVYDETNNRYAWTTVPRTVRHDDGTYWYRFRYQSHVYGNGEFRRYECTSYYNGQCYEIDRSGFILEDEPGFVDAPLEWPDVWAHTEKEEIADLLDSALGSTDVNNFNNNSTTELRQWNKDPRVRSLCAQAETEEVLIFTIAYEAPDGVKPLLKDCAVEDGRFYDTSADGRSIEEVFASISATIQNLRLTQ